MVQMEMLLKRYFLSGALTGFCSVEHNHLCNLGKRYYEEQLVLFDYWIFHNRSSKIIGLEVSIDDRL